MHRTCWGLCIEHVNELEIQISFYTKNLLLLLAHIDCRAYIELFLRMSVRSVRVSMCLSLCVSVCVPITTACFAKRLNKWTDQGSVSVIDFSSSKTHIHHLANMIEKSNIHAVWRCRLSLALLYLLAIVCLTKMTFDYQYIDPGPDDPGCTKNRYFALNVSVIWHCVVNLHSLYIRINTNNK